MSVTPQNLNLSPESQVSAISYSSVHLPKLELPKLFSDNVLEWQSFWDRFRAAVHDTELSDVTKFTYLQSLLHGKVKRALEGLSLTSEHYKKACELLQARYGRKEQIIFAHIQGLLSLHLSSRIDIEGLRQIQDQLLTHVWSLEALEIKGETYGVFLTPVILSRLPEEIRMEWARKAAGKESDLQYLLEFLSEEIQRRERSAAFSTEPHQVKVQQERKRNFVRVPTASALQTSTVQGSGCAFCRKSHPSSRCWDILKLTVPDRERSIKQAGLCFLCLRRGHIAKNCSSRCVICKGRHHSICCTVNINYNRTYCNNNNDINISNSITGSSTHSNFVMKVGLEWTGSQDITYAAFGGGKSSDQTRSIYNIKLLSNIKCVPKINQ